MSNEENVSMKDDSRSAVSGRVEEIDIIKGIGIFLMIVNHIKFGNAVTAYIRAFCMPLFFVASGYIWRDKGEGMAHRLKRRAKRLLLPYFFFGVLFCILATVVSLVKKDPADTIAEYWLKLFFYSNQAIPYCVPIWFFPCMVISDFLYTLIHRIAGRLAAKRQLLTAGTLCCAVAAVGCIYASIENAPVLFWAAEPALTAVLFMFFGTLLRRLQDGQHFDPLSIPLIPLILIFVVSTVTAFVNPLIDMRTARYCIVPLYFFNGCVMTLAWANLARRLSRISKPPALSVLIKKPLSFFKYLAEHSIPFVCLNWFFIMASNRLFQAAQFGSSPYVILIEKLVQLTLTLLLCWLFDKTVRKTPMRFLCGE